MLLGVGCGIGAVTAFRSVNPYDGKADVYYVVTQLSGSNGIVPLSVHFTNLITLSLLFLPHVLFGICMGLYLYRNYCTASVYVFSRITRRGWWYERQLLKVMTYSLLCTGLYMGTVFLITALSFEIIFREGWWKLCLFHLCMQTFWSYILALLVHIGSIFGGSSIGVLLCVVTNSFCMTLLCFGTDGATRIIHHLNPIARQVMGWHLIRPVTQEELSFYGAPVLLPVISVVFLMILMGTVTVTGIQIVRTHDFLRDGE